jgi:hypothetical protein
MVRDSRATLDACLEHVHQLHMGRELAQYHLTKLILAHPELEADRHLAEARLALTPPRSS